jgi:hypothetical protein
MGLVCNKKKGSVATVPMVKDTFPVCLYKKEGKKRIEPQRVCRSVCVSIEGLGRSRQGNNKNRLDTFRGI